VEPEVKTVWLFPLAIMLLNFSASLTYAWYGDTRRAVYWTCCTLITLVVTF
jgi:hypothetical protein